MNQHGHLEAAFGGPVRACAVLPQTLWSIRRSRLFVVGGDADWDASDLGHSSHNTDQTPLTRRSPAELERHHNPPSKTNFPNPIAWAFSDPQSCRNAACPANDVHPIPRPSPSHYIVALFA
jgi:hypothetical protein